MKVNFIDFDTFLGQSYGPIYIFIANRMNNNYTDSIISLTSFNKYGHPLEISEIVGKIPNNNNQELEMLLDTTIERERILTASLKERKFEVLTGFINAEPLPINKINTEPPELLNN
jgi:hypothetical protein